MTHTPPKSQDPRGQWTVPRSKGSVSDGTKAGARVELFTRNSLMWMEAREEADAARRAYERRLHTMSKEEGPE